MTDTPLSSRKRPAWRFWPRKRTIKRKLIDFRLRHHVRREKPLLAEARRKYANEYDPATRSDEPLVTVMICTYNRAELLVDRALKSACAQSYRNLQIVVVGDCCSDDTAERVAAVDDPRIEFENLATRGPYPSDPKKFYRVAGWRAAQRCHELARGQWVAHLDDDEMFTEDHVAVLLDYVHTHDSELVWGKSRLEMSPGEWSVMGAPGLAELEIPHSAIFWRRYLKLFAIDPECWRYNLAGDHQRLRRMYLSGVRDGFVDQVITEAPLRPNITKPWRNAEDRPTYNTGSANPQPNPESPSQ